MTKHRKGSALFQLINRKNFEQLADKWQVDKGVRGFSTWEMTHALINCFVMRLSSYREVERNLKIPDSTFGDALRERNFNFFQELCGTILLDIRARTEDRKIKKALRQIMAIDSSEINVHGSLFKEPRWQQKHVKGAHKASCKLHVVWNVDGQWIDDFRITPGRKNDSPVSLELRLLPNKIYVFDRAYNDFDFWEKVVSHKSDFVTRLKDCARWRYLEMKVLSQAGDKNGVLYDEKYKPTGTKSKKSALKLRHIIYRDAESKKIFHFITSDPKISAQTVADIYKARWAVELLFRWMKGHLHIRRLPTKTPNAIKTQLAVAVLIQLLLQLKKIVDNFRGSLWELLQAVQADLNWHGLAGSESPPDCRWNLSLVSSPRS